MNKTELKAMYAFLPDLAAEARIPERGTHSQTVFEDTSVKAVLFGFAAGVELSEHSSSHGAALHFLQGEVELDLAGDEHQVRAGAWVHMPPGLPHSLLAKTPTVMLLLLFKNRSDTKDIPS